MSDDNQHLLVLEIGEPDHLILAALRARLLDAGIDEEVFSPPRLPMRQSSGEEDSYTTRAAPPKQDTVREGGKVERSYTIGNVGAGARVVQGENISWLLTGVPWVLDHLAEPAIGLAALKVTRDVLIEWVKAKAGRRVTLSVAGKRIEVHGSRDIDHCITALEKLATSPPQKSKSIRRAEVSTGARRKTSKAARSLQKS